mmetsp:Transcript_4812/g.10599  ORF Transcript_4812/g.10599 Transcript_4812/m.10599 type:complete len:560 (-) Transcript_4812:151-1830(-)
MATHSHLMSTTNSIGTYDSLFDDDNDTFGGICFDLEAQQHQQVVTSDRKHHPSSWCKSSSSSCCSLCRPPTVSDAEDDLKMYALGNDASSSFQSRPRTSIEVNDSVSFPRGSLLDLSKSKSQAISFCGCNRNMLSSSYESCGSMFQVPVKSISIPCIDPGVSAKRDATEVSIDFYDYLSSSFLPDDALCQIVKFLDVSSLMRLRRCNIKLRDAASKNNAGWKKHCTTLWSSKANVCSLARELLTKSNKMNNEAMSNSPKYAAMEAYKVAVTDAATRKEISFEELCFDGSPSNKDDAGGGGAIWSFRFKESAGRDWTSWDPWWNRQSARKLVFLRDGTIKQVYPQGLESSAIEYNGTLLYHVFSERTVRRDQEEVPAPQIQMKWRFVNRPLDLVNRPLGAYVRITVGGRDVPTYVVRRSPNGNWGFILESCWGVYASFELAPQVPTAFHSTVAMGRGSRRRLRRARNGQGGRWVNIANDSDDDDSDHNGNDDGEFEREERTRNVRRRIDLFVEESSMTQDGYSQWREALLYNIGAVTLPEGNGDATGEFDHAWQNAMMMR